MKRKQMGDPYYEALAVYNAECHRGIVHTPEYDAEMAHRQAWWNRQTYSVPAPPPPPPHQPNPKLR